MRGIIQQVVEGILEANRAKKKERKAQNRATNWTAGATVAMAIFTFVSTGVGIAQWSVLRDTVDQMRADRRAWISIEPRARGGFLITEKGAQFIFDAKLTNHGGSPATNVRVKWRLMPAPWNGKGGAKYPPGECQQIKAEASRGISVFPGESITTRRGVLDASRQLIDAEQADGKVAFLVEICVAYYSAGDRQTHQTQNIYVLKRHWVEQKDEKTGLIMPEVPDYNYNPKTDIDVPDFENLEAFAVVN